MDPANEGRADRAYPARSRATALRVRAGPSGKARDLAQLQHNLLAYPKGRPTSGPEGRRRCYPSIGMRLSPL